MYDDYISERKAWEDWEQQQARGVPTVEEEDGQDDETFESVHTETGPHLFSFKGSTNTIQAQTISSEPPRPEDEEEIDRILTAEAKELEALIAMHEEGGQADAQNQEEETKMLAPGMLSRCQSSPYLGPDDGDFEELLLEVDEMDIS